jgi:hypothetical protein
MLLLYYSRLPAQVRTTLLRKALMCSLHKRPPFVQHSQHESLGKEGVANLKQRYGKWRRLLANQTKLSDYLHREGAEALQVFGYEPRTAFAYSDDPMNSTAFLCNENVTCSE